jgi:hypothetical protein
VIEIYSCQNEFLDPSIRYNIFKIAVISIRTSPKIGMGIENFVEDDPFYNLAQKNINLKQLEKTYGKI